MSTPQESLDLLARALDQTGAVLEAVEPSQLTDPTPCHDWDVAHLVGHLVADPRNLLAMAHGDEVDWSAAPEPPQSGWTDEFRTVRRRAAAGTGAASATRRSRRRSTGRRPSSPFTRGIWRKRPAGPRRSIPPSPSAAWRS